MVNIFRQASESMDVTLGLIAIDTVPEWSPACECADDCFQVPTCSDPRFPDVIESICSDLQVRLVIPTIDPELPVYMNHRERLMEAGASVLIPKRQVVQIANDKALTARMLDDIGVPVPETRRSRRAFARNPIKYPVVAKPRTGSGTGGVKIVEDVDDLKEIPNGRKYVVQERCQEIL